MIGEECIDVSSDQKVYKIEMRFLGFSEAIALSCT